MDEVFGITSSDPHIDKEDYIAMVKQSILCDTLDKNISNKIEYQSISELYENAKKTIEYLPSAEEMNDGFMANWYKAAQRYGRPLD